MVLHESISVALVLDLFEFSPVNPFVLLDFKLLFVDLFTEAILPADLCVQRPLFEIFIVLLESICFILTPSLEFFITFLEVMVLQFQLIMLDLKLAFIARKIGNLLFEFGDLCFQVNDVFF